MSQESYLYASARISALEKGLLSEDAVRRMSEGSLEDAMRALLDVRYGGLTDATPDDCERMIEAERQKTARVIAEVSPEPALTDLLLLKTDAHNLKILLKSRMLGRADADLLEGGLFTREKLTACVQNANYRDLPADFAAALHALEQRLRTDPQPQYISVAVDYGYLAHACAVVSALGAANAIEFVAALCDFSNVLTFLRLRAMGAAREDMKDMLLPEGGIRHRTLLDAYDLSADSLARALTGSKANTAIQKGLGDMLATGSIAALEKERDNYLLSLVKDHRYENETIYPVIGHYLARDREAKAVRLILTAKRNKLDDAVIMERLRELYG